MSDVRRGRALIVAALAAAFGLAAALFASDGAGRVLAPPPVSASHERAGLECQSCHAAESTNQACVGCHGQQRSARPEHQRLAARAELGCSDCHRAHGAEGVRVDDAGRLLHFVGQREWAHDAGGPLLAPGSALPLLARERCSACHDAARPSDPAAQCFSAASAANLCFDEHAGPAAPGHTALAEAARAVALSEAGGARAASLSRSAWQLAGAFGVGLVALLFVSRRGRRSGPAASAAPPVPRRRLPVIDAGSCLGCSACVDACPHDVLEISRHVALVARPDACCGLALCAERCPNGSLSLTLGEPAAEHPALSPELESLREPGVFLAGDVTGQALIRSAVQQGVAAARAAAGSLAREKRARQEGEFDLAIIGAGPAGLGAALEAKRLGLRAVVLEQGRFAESIQSFSREKIVLDSSASSADLPLWIGECHKDELIRRWLRTVRSQKLELREHARVLGWSRGAGGGPFELRVGGDSLRARRVILAVGRRGSPRKLDAALDEDARSRVHYSLSDARSFAGRRVVIVGLGDSAMEATLALSRQSGTTVDIVYRGSEHRRGKRRNIAEFRRLEAAGRVNVHWSSQVTRVDVAELVLSSAGVESTLAYDALFVLIGGDSSHDLLPKTVP